MADTDIRIGWVIVEKDKCKPLRTGGLYYGSSCKLYKSEGIAKAALASSYYAYDKDKFVVRPAYVNLDDVTTNEKINE